MRNTTSSKTGKGGQITHFQVVPEEVKIFYGHFIKKNSLVPISTFTETGEGLILMRKEIYIKTDIKNYKK